MQSKCLSVHTIHTSSSPTPLCPWWPAGCWPGARVAVCQCPCGRVRVLLPAARRCGPPGPGPTRQQCYICSAAAWLSRKAQQGGAALKGQQLHGGGTGATLKATSKELERRTGDLRALIRIKASEQTQCSASGAMRPLALRCDDIR